MMRESALDTDLTRNWWAIALRGAFAIVFGILTLLWPGLTVLVLVALFGAWALLDGIFSFVAAWERRKQRQTWWPLLLEGVLGVIVAGVTLFWPGLTALGLVTLIGVWAIVTGVMEFVAAIRLRKLIRNEFWLGLAGFASVIFGVLVLIFPGAGALGIAWAIGWYAILFGALLVALGFRLRGERGRAVGAGEPSVPRAAA
jgi:uncharacterized membrane protein HdeD (DUF308 family)